MECCETCKLRYEIQRWDYSHGGCEHKRQEGHVCMAFKDEGIAVWMVGSTGMCEAYTPKYDAPRKRIKDHVCGNDYCELE